MGTVEETKTVEDKELDKMKRIILFLLVLLSMLSHASAATYYVATDGNNGDPGTEGQPWDTITYAATQATAGDTVYIKGGNYGGEHVVVSNSGSSGNLITFEGYDGTPILNGGDRTGNAIHISSKDYIAFKNIDISLYRYGVRISSSDYVTIDNIDVADLGAAGYDGWGIQLTYSDYCTITNCDVTDCTANIEFQFSHYNLLENCNAYGVTSNTDYNVHYYIDFLYCQHNVIRDCTSHNQHPGSGHKGHGIGVKDYPLGDGSGNYNSPHSTNNTFYDCTAINHEEGMYVAHPAHDTTFINCTGQNTASLSGSFNNALMVRDGAHDNYFYNCTAIGKKQGVCVYDYGESLPNTIQYNNMFENCIFRSIGYTDSVGIYLRNTDNTTFKNCIVDDFYYFIRYDGIQHVDDSMRNCIIIDTDNSYDSRDLSAPYGGQGYNDAGNMDFDYSNFYGNGFATPSGTGNIGTDPQFYNDDQYNYYLKSVHGRWTGSTWTTDGTTSPAIDTGSSSDSYSNEPEDNGNRINMGAYGNTIHASKSGEGAPTYWINGTVTTGGSPLNEANTADNQSVDTDITDGSGNYNMQGYVNGTYNITVSKTFYTNGYIVVEIDGASNNSADVSLTEIIVYNINGTVTYSGSPLTGVSVVDNASVDSDTTDASGYFNMSGYINDTYQLTFSKTGYDTDYLDVTINGADNDTADISMSLSLLPLEGYDNRIKSSAPDTVYSDITWLDVGGEGTTKYRSWIWFNLTGYDSQDVITEANLNLFWHYVEDTRDKTTNVGIYIPKYEVNTNFLTWNNRVDGVAWDTSGGDWLDADGTTNGSVPFASELFPLGEADMEIHTFDLTDLVQSMINESRSNYGFFIIADETSDNYIAFPSLERETESWRPTLVITYSSPPPLIKFNGTNSWTGTSKTMIEHGDTDLRSRPTNYDDMVAWWSPETGVGSSSILTDLIGSNDGTISEATWQSEGLHYDGTDDYTSFSNEVLSRTSSAVSIRFNTSADFSGGYGGIGNILGHDSKYVNYIGTVGDGLSSYDFYGETGLNGEYIVDDSSIAPVDTSNTAVISFDSNVAKTYFNKALIDTSGTLTNDLTLSKMGRAGLSTDTPFEDIIGEVRIFDQPLTSDEADDIQDNYHILSSYLIITGQIDANEGNIISGSNIVGTDAGSNTSILIQANLSDDDISYAWYDVYDGSEIGVQDWSTQKRYVAANGIKIYFNTTYQPETDVIEEIQILSTDGDTTPPGPVTGLSADISVQYYHNWTWTNPVDTDYSYSNIYINETWAVNSSVEFYNLSSSAGTTDNISIRTVDLSGNVGTTWVNHSSTLSNTDTIFEYWDGAAWQENPADYHLWFDCFWITSGYPDGVAPNAEQTGSQHSLRITNNGTGAGTPKMKFNESSPAEVTVYVDDDYTVAGAVIITDAYQAVGPELGVGENVTLSAWVNSTGLTSIWEYEVYVDVQ